uniref:Uncharacterized protein n=1 Tax=Manihot esculenta TaxID=3983 RepID=A0A2C9WER6_MANES
MSFRNDEGTSWIAMSFLRTPSNLEALTVFGLFRIHTISFIPMRNPDATKSQVLMIIPFCKYSLTAGTHSSLAHCASTR